MLEFSARERRPLLPECRVFRRAGNLSGRVRKFAGGRIVNVGKNSDEKETLFEERISEGPLYDTKDRGPSRTLSASIPTVVILQKEIRQLLLGLPSTLRRHTAAWITSMEHQTL